MYNLTKKQKLNFITEKAKELEVSGYEIGKKTGLNISGVERILNGSVKNPHEKTLNTIIEFLENKVLGSEIGKAAEPSEIYNTDKNDLRELANCKTELQKLTLEIVKLQGILRANNIDFVNIFEIQ